MLPHHHTVQSSLSAKLWYAHATSIIFSSPSTCIGYNFLTVVQSHNWPLELDHHVHTVQSFFKAIALSNAAEIEIISLKYHAPPSHKTWTGSLLFSVVQSHNWPWLLDHHAQTVQSFFSA